MKMSSRDPLTVTMPPIDTLQLPSAPSALSARQGTELDAGGRIAIDCKRRPRLGCPNDKARRFNLHPGALLGWVDELQCRVGPVGMTGSPGLVRRDGLPGGHST